MIVTHIPEKFTGIIQLSPSDDTDLKKLQDSIISQFPEQKRIGKIDKDGTFISKLHVTCLHQGIPKLAEDHTGLRGDKALKAWFKTNRSTIETPKINLGRVGIITQDGKISTFVRITNPEVIREFRNTVIASAGLDLDTIDHLSNIDVREAGRIFHISLTNLTGNTGDSVANISNGINILENK